MAINPDTPPPVDSIERSEHCGICELHSDVEHLREVEIWRSRHWLLRHHPHPSPLLGWCLLDARRHLAGAIDFLGDEAAEWGTVVQQASKLVQDGEWLRPGLLDCLWGGRSTSAPASHPSVSGGSAQCGMECG